MKVLIVAQHYYPEVTAAVNRLTSLTEAITRGGNEACVIAPKPNHPQGVIAEHYRGPLVKTEVLLGTDVHYTWVYTSPRKSVLRRLLYYISFMLMAVLAAFRLKGRYDIVFASSPPPLVGIAGWVIAKIKRARFILDVRDLWPGLAIAIGELQNPIAIGAARAVESFCYGRADGIVAVTKPFQEEICRRIANRVPVEMIPNGALPIFLEAGRYRATTREDRGWQGRYVVSYIGNIGVCQGLMHLVQAAEQLQSLAPEVLFFVQGSGIVKKDLAAAIKSRNLTNIVMSATVPTEEAAVSMAASDALIVPLARVALAAQFVPSKLFDSMATGTPVLLSVDGVAREIVEKAGAGISYEPENGRALAGAILQLRADPQSATMMGNRGQEYVKANYMRSNLSDRIVLFLEKFCDSTSIRQNAHQVESLQ
jgi:glycosyltransferase involved in cell wall biosynthesis